EPGDATRVPGGHREGRLPRGLPEQGARAVAALALDLLQGREPRQKFSRVGWVLIVGEPFDPGKHHRARLAAELARGALHEVADGGRRGPRGIIDKSGHGEGGLAAARRFETRGKGGEAALDPDLTSADRRLAGR